MDCSRCGKCCAETGMQLSPRDISRLKRIGYNPADFSTRKNGFATLRNVKGVCYFFERETNTCKVYAKRPEGCRYYPIVYSLDETEPVIDAEVCQQARTVTAEDLAETAPRLARLAKLLIKNRV